MCRFFYFWLIMFLLHQMSVGMFRLMGAVGRTIVIATTMGSTLVLFIVTLSGFVLAHPQVIFWTWNIFRHPAEVPSL